MLLSVGRYVRLLLEDHAHVMQAGNEAAAVDLSRAAGPVAEPDNVGAVLAEASGESEPLRVVRQGHKPGLFVAVIAHQDCELPGGLEGTGTVSDELAVTPKERLQRRSAGEIAGIVCIQLLPPVGRVCPDEVEGFSGEALGVAGINASVDVPGHAGDAEFFAYILARPAAGHWVQEEVGPEVQQQIADEVAAAVAGI